MDQETKPAPFRVLSIDGGGIRGLYAIKILMSLEKLYLPPEKKRWHEHFDLIVGTSTGGIIAAALAVGIPLETMQALYETQCKEIFTKHPRGVLNKLLEGVLSLFRIKGEKFDFLLQPKYTSENLRELLTATFHSGSITEAKTGLMLTAFDMTDGRTHLFERPVDQAEPAHEIAMVDALLATTAAPVYFPMHKFKLLRNQVEHRFTDGGVWANNPALVGLTEAFKQCDNSNHGCIQLLSIGTANKRSYKGLNRGNDVVWMDIPHLRNSGIFWLKNIYPVMAAAQAMNVEYTIEHMKQSGLVDYLRLNIAPGMKLELDDCSNSDKLAALAENTNLPAELTRFFTAPANHTC